MQIVSHFLKSHVFFVAISVWLRRTCYSVGKCNPLSHTVFFWSLRWPKSVIYGLCQLVWKLHPVTSKRVAFFMAALFSSSSFFFSSSSSLDLLEEFERFDKVDVITEPFLCSVLELTRPLGRFFFTVRGDLHRAIIESLTLARSVFVGTPSLLLLFGFLKKSLIMDYRAVNVMLSAYQHPCPDQKWCKRD